MSSIVLPLPFERSNSCVEITLRDTLSFLLGEREGEREKDPKGTALC